MSSPYYFTFIATGSWIASPILRGTSATPAEIVSSIFTRASPLTPSKLTVTCSPLPGLISWPLRVQGYRGVPDVIASTMLQE
jgi:hypothetical protein